METIQIQSIGKSELESIIMRCVATALRNQKPQPQPEGFVTRPHVCGLLCISLPTLHAWMKSGKLKAYHIGGRTLFKESEVMEAVKPVNYDLKKERR